MASVTHPLRLYAFNMYVYTIYTHHIHTYMHMYQTLQWPPLGDLWSGKRHRLVAGPPSHLRQRLRRCLCGGRGGPSNEPGGDGDVYIYIFYIINYYRL